MADQIKVATFTTRSGAGTQDFTHPELTDAFTAALFIYGGTSTDSSDVAHGRLGMGACCIRSPALTDSQNAAYVTQRDNSSLSAPDENTIRKASSGSACIIVTTGDNSLNNDVFAVFDSAITNGVRLNFTTADIQVKVTVVFFAGFANAGVGASATGTGTVSIQTGVSPFFQPDVLLFFGGGGTLNTDASDAQVNLGFAVRNGGQVSAFVNSDDVTEPTDADGHVSTSQSIAEYQGTTRTTRLASTTFNADGFTITADNSTSRTFMYLALEFADDTQAQCVAASISGSTGSQNFTGFGFTPAVVLGMSTLIASANSDISGATASASGLFVTGEEGERAYSERGENGRSGTAISFNRSSRQEDVGILTLNHLGSVAQRATWVGGVSDGFSMSFSDATAGYLIALGFSGGALTSVADETERISDGHALNLISRLFVNESVSISDGVGGLLLADGLTDLDDTGAVFAGNPDKGTVLQGGAQAGVVEG